MRIWGGRTVAGRTVAKAARPRAWGLRASLAMALGAAMAGPGAGTALAGPGDLLVAPTRVTLDQSVRSTEVILNNIGSATATYRISLEIKRMTPEGDVIEVGEAERSALESAALAMVQYSPRRIVLPPNQPQVVRVGLRRPPGLADGEYRVHMLFRAIPDAQALTTAAAPPVEAGALRIAITPIYGLSIPVIVREGSLAASVTIGRAWLEAGAGERAGGGMFHIELERSGTASTYGEVIVERAGKPEPLLMARGIAIYPEVGRRRVSLPVDAATAAALRGPVTVRYVEDRDKGGATLASAARTID